MKPQKLTPEQVQNNLTQAVTDAISFIETDITPRRVKAQEYFNGLSSVKADKLRSSVVATKCRDTIRAVKPGIMRLFMQSHKPVEFIPSSPQAVVGAEQATNYARYIFNKNDGFRALHGATHDALVKITGIIKPYYEENTAAEVDEYSDLSPEQVQFLRDNPENEIVEESPESLTVSRKSKSGAIKFVGIPPEDFFVDRDAVSIRSYYCCGHSRKGRVSELVEMGFDFEEVLELATEENIAATNEEKQIRTNQSGVTDETTDDPSMKHVTITEAYMRMDIKGTGVARPYKFICAGKNHTILDKSLCDHLPFAIFEVDPEPHTFFGRSLVEIIMDDQDAATILLRGFLDGVGMANNPRMAAVEGQVNMDDLLNNEIGGVIRVMAPGMLQEITMGTGTAMVMPAMQYFDELIKVKTGVTGAGMGLDVEALSAQTATGVRMLEQNTAAVSDLMARHLAEGGMKQLFEIIAQLARQHPNPDEMMRVDGQFVPVDPTSWGTQMDMIANVGIGTGQREEQMATLNQIQQTQGAIWQGYGPQNGIVGLTEIRATLVDIARLGGVYNGDRYYKAMSPEIEAQLALAAAEAAQGAQQATDPNEAYLQVEQGKSQIRMQEIQMKAQLESQKAQTDARFKTAEMMRQDDLARDQMLQDLALKVAELLQKGVQVNTPAIQAQQEAPRV